MSLHACMLVCVHIMGNSLGLCFLPCSSSYDQLWLFCNEAIVCSGHSRGEIIHSTSYHSKPFRFPKRRRAICSRREGECLIHLPLSLSPCTLLHPCSLAFSSSHTSPHTTPPPIPHLPPYHTSPHTTPPPIPHLPPYHIVWCTHACRYLLPIIGTMNILMFTFMERKK